MRCRPGVASFEGKWWENGEEDAPAMNRLTASLWSPAGQPAYNEVFVTVEAANYLRNACRIAVAE